jgi:uncharacterized protein (TIGR03083 family)
VVQEIDTQDPCAELFAARRDLLAVLETLEPDDWDRPTLCEHWRVRDVVAHLAQIPDMRTLKLVPRFLKARGSVSRLRDEAARSEGEQPPAEIIAHFKANLDCVHLPPGTSPGKALVDTVIHSLDICHSNGWDLKLPADRVRTVLSTMVTLGDPFGGKSRAEGLHFDTTDVDWRCGCGDDVRGPAALVLLALAGRPVCDALTGDGVAVLSQRS